MIQLTQNGDSKLTPWQRVYAKFGKPQSEFARLINRHKSKISRALRDDKGLINGPDQVLLIKVAQQLNIDLKPDDLVPVKSDD